MTDIAYEVDTPTDAEMESITRSVYENYADRIDADNPNAHVRDHLPLETFRGIHGYMLYDAISEFLILRASRQ